MYFERIGIRSHQLGAIDLNAGAHGGSHHAALDILALGGGGLGLDDGAQQSGIVLIQLVRAEGNLAEDASITMFLFCFRGFGRGIFFGRVSFTRR